MVLIAAGDGRAITAALQREILETIARIEESLHLFDRADDVLARAVEASLTRAQIGLRTIEPGIVGGKNTGAPD